MAPYLAAVLIPLLLWLLWKMRLVWRADRAARRTQEAELQMIEAEAQEAQARAALLAEEVETARARRGLIPANYIGAQLDRPADSTLYHVWTFKQDWPVAAAKAADEAAPALTAPLPRAASIYEMLPALDEARGRILLGFDASGPIWLEVSDLLSVAMAGNSGRGKSKALLWLSLQLIRAGVTTIFLDGKGDLRWWLSPYHPVAYAPAEIQRSVDAMVLEADWRLRQAADDAAATFAPVLVIIDELDLVMGRYEPTLKLIELLTKKTRSVNMHGIYSNQSVPAELVGGVHTRGVIVSRICLYCDDEAARMLGVRANNGAAALLQQLAPPAPPGLAVARTAVFGWKIVAFAYVPDGAIAWLLREAVELPPLPPNRNRVSPSPEVTQNAPPVPVSEREKERNTILELHALGLKPYVIARQMGKAGAYAEHVKHIIAEATHGTHGN